MYSPGPADGQLVPFIQMTPVNHAALAGSSTCLLRLWRTAPFPAPGGYLGMDRAGSRKYLTIRALAVARRPRQKSDWCRTPAESPSQVHVLARMDDGDADSLWDAFVVEMLATGKAHERRSRCGDKPAV